MNIVEGESEAPEYCTEIGKCVVRDLPDNLAAQTPIEVRFRYLENGRLTIVVSVGDREMLHEMTRENSLSEEQLKSWRQYIAAVGSLEKTLPGKDAAHAPPDASVADDDGAAGEDR